MKVNYTNIGHYMQIIRQHQRRLNDDEYKNLIAEAKSGNAEAMNTIILSNIAMVVEIGKRYCGLAPFEDIIGMGILGFYDAVRLYDPERGYKFSTYAFYWIRQRISRGVVDYQNLIRLPDKLRGELYRILRSGNDIEDVDDEMLEKANVSRMHYQRLTNAPRAVPFPELEDSDDDFESVTGSEDENLEKIYDADEARKIIQIAEETLTAKQMQIFREIFLRGKSIRQLARERRISARTIQYTAKYIRWKIRSRLGY